MRCSLALLLGIALIPLCACAQPVYTAAERAEIIADVQTQSGDPTPIETNTAAERAAQVAADRAEIIADIQAQTGDPAPFTPLPRIKSECCWGGVHPTVDEILNETIPENEDGFPPSIYAMNESNQAELEVLNKALADAYTQALSYVDGSARALLARSQFAWRQYREVQCLAEGDREAGGSLEDVLVSNCQVRETQARVKWLKDEH